MQDGAPTSFALLPMTHSKGHIAQTRLTNNS